MNTSKIVIKIVSTENGQAIIQAVINKVTHYIKVKIIEATEELEFIALVAFDAWQNAVSKKKPAKADFKPYEDFWSWFQLKLIPAMSLS